MAMDACVYSKASNCYVCVCLICSRLLRTDTHFPLSKGFENITDHRAKNCDHDGSKVEINTNKLMGAKYYLCI